MHSAQQVRTRIEIALAEKNPSALIPAKRTVRQQTASGSQALDEISKGGLPCGAITEFVGVECSGRTTMAMAYIAAITQAGKVCAWIDVADALDPSTTAANGVNLERLLWVRCGRRQRPSQTFDTHQDSPMPTGVFVPQHRPTGGSPHPRSESGDMPQAISALLQAHGGLHDRQLRREKKAIGTPGVPNRPITWRSENRQEQVNSDRMPPRRGSNLRSTISSARYCTKPHPPAAPMHSGNPLPSPSFAPLIITSSAVGKPWQALDQALRAADLLLQGGGFNIIVLDLGSTPPEIAWRIPLATWFRFRAACERTRVSLLLLTQHPCARSSAELTVGMETGTMEAQSKVMTGIRYRAATERSRFHEQDGRVLPLRKSPQSERLGEWKREAAWAQMK